MCFPGGCAKVMFVTNDTFRGPELGGVDGADAKCQQRAQAVGLMGTYRAWIATMQYGPASSWPRLTVPYVNRAGAVIANGWSDLVSGKLLHAVSLTEFGQPITGGYWTGANSAGFGTGNDCAGWTTPGGHANAGAADSTQALSEDLPAPYCGPWYGMDSLESLLCVEQ
jgi:hypothetical protein